MADQGEKPASLSECISLADRLGPMTPEERSAFYSQIAEVRYRDERMASNQPDLLDKAT